MAIKIFSAGAGACVADLITFPLDTAKVRLQVERETGMGSTSGQGDLIPALVYASFLRWVGQVATLKPSLALSQDRIP